MSPPIGSARAGLVSQVDAIPDSAILNIKATGYDDNNNEYVANIGPNVPDAGGDPSTTTDTVAGTSGVTVVDYNDTNDYSKTTNISTSSDIIAIVWTGKTKTANDNGILIDGGSDLELAVNDDGNKDGYRLFRGGSNQAVDNAGSVSTGYATYSLIGRNGDEIGLKRNNNLIAGFSAGQSSAQLSGLTINARSVGKNYDGSRIVELTVLDDTDISTVDSEASRQGESYGTF